MKTYLIDIIIIPTILFFCLFTLLMNIPGYGEICDQDAGYLLIFSLVFFAFSLIFLLRNLSELSKNNKSKFRKTSLIVFIVLSILSLGGLNKLIFIFWFGQLKYQANSTVNNMVFIKLFENGKFYSEGFYTSCYEEITGTYKIENDNIRLDYKKQSEFISKNYKITNNELINFDEKKDTLLIKQNNK